MELNQLMLIIVGIVGIVLGLAILVKPKILAWVAGIYFIIIGVVWIIRALV